MLLLTRRVAAALFAALSIAMLAGCGDGKSPTGKTQTGKTVGGKTPGEHTDPHDVPLTDAEKDTLRKETAAWADAIAKIKSFRDEISKETTEGMAAKAHRPLDKLDLVLEWLPEVAQKSNIPKEQWESIGETAQQLRDLFEKVHENIDDKKDPDYGSVAKDIDAAIDKLAAIKPAAPTN